MNLQIMPEQRLVIYMVEYTEDVMEITNVNLLVLVMTMQLCMMIGKIIQNLL